MLRSGHTTRKTVQLWLEAPNHLQLTRGAVSSLQTQLHRSPCDLPQHRRGAAAPPRAPSVSRSPEHHQRSMRAASTMRSAPPPHCAATAPQGNPPPRRANASKQRGPCGWPPLHAAATRPLALCTLAGISTLCTFLTGWKGAVGYRPECAPSRRAPRQSGTQRRAIADSPAGRRVARLSAGAQGC